MHLSFYNFILIFSYFHYGIIRKLSYFETFGFNFGLELHLRDCGIIYIIQLN
jgi:hypothetical protein